MAFDTVTRAGPIAAAFRSRPLQFLLLLACVTAGYTSEPPGARGAGTMTYESYLLAVHAPHERNTVESAAEAREWVRGYFAGRNAESNSMRTVGGSLSNEDFEARLIDECRNTHWSYPLHFAAAGLYQKLEAKGL